MVASRSYVILMAPDERQALLDRVRQLAGAHPATAGQPEMSLPTSPSAGGAACLRRFRSDL